MTKLKVAISTCPNDTFMFEALYNNRIDAKGLEFEWKFADIEELNKGIKEQEADISKMSFNAFFSQAQNYMLINSGAALGYNCGPQLIAAKLLDEDKLDEIKVAVPGKSTTANLLLSVFYPEIKNKQEMLFSAIESAILREEVDAGLIIHETRFTYEDNGLVKIGDMGELWEQQYKLPLPLGAIAAHRRLDTRTIQLFDELLRESIQYAFDHFEEVMPFVREHAQSLSDEVMRAHIHLYVNKYSLALGEEGKEAVQVLYSHARQQGWVDQGHLDFLNS